MPTPVPNPYTGAAAELIILADKLYYLDSLIDEIDMYSFLKSTEDGVTDNVRDTLAPIMELTAEFLDKDCEIFREIDRLTNELKKDNNTTSQEGK